MEKTAVKYLVHKTGNLNKKALLLFHPIRLLCVEQKVFNQSLQSSYLKGIQTFNGGRKLKKFESN